MGQLALFDEVLLWGLLDLDLVIEYLGEFAAMYGLRVLLPHLRRLPALGIQEEWIKGNREILQFQIDVLILRLGSVGPGGPDGAVASVRPLLDVLVVLGLVLALGEVSSQGGRH